MKRASTALLLACLAAAGLAATASAQAGPKGERTESGARRYERLEAVLAHLGAADEHDYGADLAPFDGRQTREGFERLLKIMDPAGQLQRYLDWSDDGVVLFQDRDARSVRDLELRFARPGTPVDEAPALRSDLERAAAGNAAARPLAGLRVALDPGHMGTRFWDVKTGKYVSIAEGTVSEGEINFQVCLLLKQRLEALGAQTMITRHGLTPVTDEPLESYDLAPWADREVRNSADEPWFDRLLSEVPDGPLGAISKKLFALFDQSRELGKLRASSQRSNYFISRLDLSDRARRITEFHPHLTLVVHFDAAETNHLQTEQDAVRSYVMGDIFADEVGSRELRAGAIRDLFTPTHWSESNRFGTAIVRSLSAHTGVPMLDAAADYHGLRVSEGVYARNLALSRLVTESAMAYVEILHYDYSPEFRKLLERDRHAEIEGVAIDYPARLDEIVEGLAEGVTNYVGSFASGRNSSNLY